MFEQLVSELLNQYLDKFIEDIDSKQLGTSMYSGTIKLQNMTLKPTMFDNSPLPFSLQYGQVGLINIKIPFWDMFKSPLEITIENIFGFIKFKDLKDWQEDLQIQAFQESNQALLEQYELFLKNQFVLEQTKRDTGPSFSEKLIARIMDNLRVSIKNVYFRFEDSYSIMVKNQQGNWVKERENFSMGLKLKEFSIFTTDKNFESIKEKKRSDRPKNTKNHKLDDEEYLTFKTIKLEGFSLFCNWDNTEDRVDLVKLRNEMSNNGISYFQKVLKSEFDDENKNSYFLENLKIQLNLQLNNDIKNPLMPGTINFPQYKTELFIGAIDKFSGEQSAAKLCLHQPQVLRFLKVMERIGQYNTYKEGVISVLLKNKLSPTNKQKYLKTFIEYLNNTKKLEKESNKNKKDLIEFQQKSKKIMREIEDTVDHKQIIELRNQAHERVRSEDVRQSKLDEIEKQIQAEISKQIGYGLFMSSNKKILIERDIRNSFQPQIEEVKNAYVQEQTQISQNIQNLLNDLKDDGGELEDIDFSLLKDDYVYLDIRIDIPKIQFALVNEFTQELFCMNIIQLDFRMEQQKNRNDVLLNLKDVTMDDCWIKTEKWSKIMETKAQNDNQDAKALKIEFKQDKDFKKCPFKVKVKAEKSCHAVANFQLMNEVMRTMSIALKNEKLDFHYFIEKALNQLNQMKERAQQFADDIQAGQYMHQNADIEAVIFAPVLIMPQDIFDPHQRYVKIDLGMITVGSELQQYNNKKDYKLEEDEALLYDIYNLRLQNINMQVVEYIEGQEDYSKILQDVTLGMTVKNCLEPLHPIYPTFKVAVESETPISIEIVDIFDLLLRLIEMKESLLVEMHAKNYHIIERKILTDFKYYDLDDGSSNQIDSGQNDLPQIQTYDSLSPEQEKNTEMKAGDQSKLRRDLSSTMEDARIERENQKNREQLLKDVDKQDKEIEPNIKKKKQTGTKMQFSFIVPQVRLVLGIQDDEGQLQTDRLHIKQKKGLLKDSNRFIFELKEVEMGAQIEQDTQEMKVDMSIQKIEIREEMKGVPDEMDLKDQSLLENRDNLSQQGNLFKKILFWNEKRAYNLATQQQSKIDDPQNTQFKKNHQLNAKVFMKQSQVKKDGYDNVIQQDMRVDMLMRQTIFLINFQTQKRVILAMKKLMEVQEFDQLNIKKTYQVERQIILKAVQAQINNKDQAKRNVKYRYIGLLFMNLASRVKQNGKDTIQNFFKKIEDILESDDEIKALAFQVQQIKEQQSPEKKQEDEKVIMGQASMSLIKAEEVTSKHIVKFQQHIQNNILMTMHIDSIEMWVSDYSKKRRDVQHVHHMAQVLQFKFGQELSVNMSQFVKQLLVAKQKVEGQDKVLFEENKMTMVNKLVNQNDFIKFQLKKIQMAQCIFNSWEAASDQLLSDQILHHQISNMLAPANITIDMNTQSDLNLDRTQLINIKMDEIYMSLDYKDIQLLHTLNMRYQRTIQPSLEIFVEQIDAKVKEVKERLKKNVEQAINEQLYQQKSQFNPARFYAGKDDNKEQDDDEDEDSENQDKILENQNPVEQRLDLRSYSPEYIDSINFYVGREININLPIMFRKDSKSIEIKIERGIQFKFCDGVLADFQKDKVERSIPLVQFKFDELQFDIWQIDHDLGFDPLTGIQQQIPDYEQSQDFEIMDNKPPYLAVIMSLRLEGRYFNQLTQYFEPFIEPWKLRKEIIQKTKTSHFDIFLNSDDRLDLNVTYGMAASLRNIQNEINDIFVSVEEEMKYEDRLLTTVAEDDDDFNQILQSDRSPQLPLKSVRDATTNRFAMINQMINNNAHELAPQDRDQNHLYQIEQEQINPQTFDNIQSYTIKNYTGLDIQIMNVSQLMVIEQNKGKGLSQTEIDNQEKRINQVIEITCDDIDSQNQNAILMPQKQKVSVDLQKLFSNNDDVDQIEEDINKVNFKLTGQFLKHGAESNHEFFGIQIEKNGIYGYESVFQDPADFVSTMSQSQYSRGSSDTQSKSISNDAMSNFEMTEGKIEMIMNISSKGTQRTISFESQMVISNNTEFPITLLFTFQHVEQSNPFSQDDQILSKQQNIEELSIDLAEFDEFKVPLKWYAMTNDKDKMTKIDMYMIKKRDGQHGFQNDDQGQKELIFEDITRKFRGKPKNALMQRIKSKIVELHDDLYLSVDVQGYACLPERTQDTNPVQFLIQINPPLVIYNKTMCALQVWEIDFPDSYKQELKLQSKIPAGMSDSLYQLDVLNTDVVDDQERSDILFKFFDNNAEKRQGIRTVITKKLQSLLKYSVFDKDDKDDFEKIITGFKKKKDQYTELDFSEQFFRHTDFDISNGKPVDLLEEEVRINIHATKRSKNVQSQYQHQTGSNYADNLLRECIIDETRAIQLSLYPKYMIVNKTSIDIMNGDQIIKSKHSDFLRLEEGVSSLKLHAVDYSLSQPIDLNQIGMTGTIEMDSVVDKLKQLQFGVTIKSAPDPFNMTIVVTVVPRYLIVNKLGKDVLLRQFKKIKKVNGETPAQDNSNVIHSFQDDVNELDGFLKTEFHFDKQIKKNIIQKGPQAPFMMQFRLLQQGYAKQAAFCKQEDLTADWILDDDSTYWAQPFWVDQLDDFQTQIIDHEALKFGVQKAENEHWYEASNTNEFKRVVRVIITSNSQDDDATLLIILENPATEEFLIQNKTGIHLHLYKYDKMKKQILDSVPSVLEGHTDTPFVWDNREINDKTILIVQPENTKKKGTASLDQVSKFDQKKKDLKHNVLFNLKVKNDQITEPRIIQLYSVLEVNEMSTKILRIMHKEMDPSKRRNMVQRSKGSQINDDQQSDDDKQNQINQESEALGIDQQYLLEYEDPDTAKGGSKGFEFSMNLKGMGISIIDNQPRELFYATLSDFKFDFKLSTSTKKIKKQNENLITTKTDFRLSIGNLQVDNMLDDQMSVMFCPAQLYKDLVLTERNYNDMGPLQREYRAIESIEKVQQKKEVLDQQIANYQAKPTSPNETLKKIPFIIVNVVKNTKQYENKIGQIVRFDEIHCAMQEFKVSMNTGMIINLAKFGIQTTFLFKKDDMNYVTELTNMQFEESSQKKTHEICPMMDATKGVQIDEQHMNVNKLSFGIIMLGSIKSTFNITLDKSKVEDLKEIYNKAGIGSAIYLVGPLLQSFASMSDLVIQFHELIILESFISQDMLVKNIINYYKYQVKSKVFRILGSSNLLGNPAGLLDKVGHGVFQMARDPIVGMSQGPTQFVRGVGTGMQGLVKGVIGGSFNSLGNISGSMYAVIKSTTGQEDKRNNQVATGVVSGVKQGVKGFGSEVVNGLSGVVRRPAEGASQGGVKGFFKGVGKGIVGVISTPITGTLRAGESVSQGISGTATAFSNVGKSLIELIDPRNVRVRESRRVDLKGRISAYDDELAIVNFYLLRIKDGQFADQQIRLFETLPDPCADGTMRRDRVNLLVITTDYLFVIKPQNFIDGKRGKVLDQNIIMIERLKDIYEYKVMMSEPLQIEPKPTKNKTIEPIIVESGFFLVIVSAVEQQMGGSRQHKHNFEKIELQKSQLDVKVDMFSPQDHMNSGETAGDQLQFQQSKDQIYLDDQRIGHQQSLSKSIQLRENRAIHVIENQSLTTITTRLHQNFKVKDFYNEIQDFSYLKVGKVNGVNLTRESILVKMFKCSGISQTSSTLANELGNSASDQSSSENPDKLQIRVQHPNQLFHKLHRLATHAKRRTVIYSDRYEVFERVFHLINRASHETSENSMILNQLRKEIRFYGQAQTDRDQIHS